MLSAGDDEWATALRDAFAVRVVGDPPGDPPLLCRLLLGRFSLARDRSLVEKAVEVFVEQGEIGALGAGLVKAIPWIADPKVAQDWADAWHEIARFEPDLILAADGLGAAVAWIQREEQVDLLRLPSEQRVLIQQMLEEWVRRRSQTGD